MSSETQSVASIALPERDATVTVATLIDLFMAQYAGRDSTPPQRLRWWQEQIGALTLAHLNDNPDPIASALKRLTQRHGMYYGGSDATGHATPPDGCCTCRVPVARPVGCITSTDGWSVAFTRHFARRSVP
jgi:hypothetical protein